MLDSLVVIADWGSRCSEPLHVVYEIDAVMFFDYQGTLIAKYPWPAAGTRYVGSDRSRGRTAQYLPIVTNVLTHEVSPVS